MKVVTQAAIFIGKEVQLLEKYKQNFKRFR
jgi:hypothetical protein